MQQYIQAVRILFCKNTWLVIAKISRRKWIIKRQAFLEFWKRNA